MIVYRQNDDYEPLTWVGGRPVYVTTLIVALHVMAYLLGALAGFAFSGGAVSHWIDALAFQSNSVLERGALWEWGTYFLVHRGEHPLFFALEMVCLYFFGRDVEQYIGRRKYVLLYGLLVLIPPVALTILALFTKIEILIPTQLAAQLSGAQLYGAWHIHFAVFLTFAKLYPGVQFFLRIPAIWLAMGLLALSVTMDAMAGRWSAMLAILIASGTVWLFLLNLRGGLPTLSAVRERLSPGSPEFPAAPLRPSSCDPMERIDPILDKIAESGLESLSPEEVEKLEEARRDLLEKKMEKKNRG